MPPCSARPGRLVRHGIRTAVAATAAVLAPSCSPPRQRRRADRSLRPLGDSYTSGPVIPTQTDLNCLRSNHDYPRLTATAIGSASLADVSCAGATTSDILNPGLGELGTSVPAQISAVTSTTSLVTVGIGGNEIGFAGHPADDRVRLLVGRTDLVRRRPLSA